jgi:cyclophilin family peptidyl-prolyl cis-trans isomerase
VDPSTDRHGINSPKGLVCRGNVLHNQGEMYSNNLGVWLLLLGFALTGIFCGSPANPPAEEEPPAVLEETLEGEPVAILDTDHGQIVFALLKDIAPKTVDRFIELAEVGFYNRTTFHRVIAGDMIQGGDPNSRDNDPYNDGQGSSGSNIVAEISDHEFDRGTVAMAHRPGDLDSGSCQFFIILRRVPEWDGKYTAFGKVLEGIEIVEKISNAPLSKSTHPAMKQRPAGKQMIKGVRIEYRDLVE